MILLHKALKNGFLVWTMALLSPVFVHAKTSPPLYDEVVLKNWLATDRYRDLGQGSARNL